ncbi:MAG: tetratricopeptide repeat protein [Nitrospirae bacterium]|nr:tetratricopeptide repeat protein [Nitrospirota bacterium]
MIIVFGVISYSNSFNVPLLFDDYQIKAIVTNFNPWLISHRQIVNLTLFLNYKLHGYNVVGYHIFNLAIHLINAFFVYLLIEYLNISQRHFYDKSNEKATLFSQKLALFISLLFVTHPLQLQAVTLTIQRSTLLATMFYLLTINLYLKWRFFINEKSNHIVSPQNASNNVSQINFKSICLYMLAFITALGGTLTKQSVVTLPVIITIIEFTFFYGKPLKRLSYSIPFYLTIPVILSLSRGYLETNDVTIGKIVTGQLVLDRWQNLFTQFRVIITYIRMLCFPVNLTLIYDYPFYLSFWIRDVYISFIVLSSIFVLGVYLSYHALKNRDGRNSDTLLISFGILWFFITISPQSSIIPLNNWVILEYRVYLASVGFFVVLVGTLFKIVNTINSKRLEGIVFITLFTILLLYTASTYNRNNIWRSEITVFEDNIKKSPNSIFAYVNLGSVYMEAGRGEDALKTFEAALKIAPRNTDALISIGTLYAERGDIAGAVRKIQYALRINPRCKGAHISLANIYAKTGEIDKAIREYMAELLVDNSAEVHNNLGYCYEKLNDVSSAIVHYERAIELSPDFAEAHNNIGALYHSLGNFYGARKEYETALKIKPDYAEATENLRLLQNQTR